METNEDGLDYLTNLQKIADRDVAALVEKERTYRGSWKKRGGVGAFMMLARKWDRLENMVERVAYDLFYVIGHDPERLAPGADGTALAEVRDLRRYLMLTEAWMMAQGVGSIKPGMVVEVHSREENEDTTAFGYPDTFRNIKFAPSGPLTPHPDFPVDERAAAAETPKQPVDHLGRFVNLDLEAAAADDSQREAEEAYFWRGRRYRKESTSLPRVEAQLLEALPFLKSWLASFEKLSDRPFDPETSVKMLHVRDLIHSIEAIAVPKEARGV